jgi:flagellar biosynthetic protein FliP
MAHLKRPMLAVILLLGLVVLLSGCATQGDLQSPALDLGPEVMRQVENPQTVSSSIQLLLLMTALTFIPAFLMMVTGFTRIVIVLSFVRTALSTPQIPPNHVLIGLAIFLTIFVMAPTWTKINDEALQPYLNEEITQQEAIDRGLEHVREFLFRETREQDIALFVHLSDLPRPKTPADVPTYVLIPAFIISELKTAFQMGLLIFIPFLIIDMVVASALMSMGMMMLPPSLISLPFKLLLFIMVDGWSLIVKSLVSSF